MPCGEGLEGQELVSCPGASVTPALQAKAQPGVGSTHSGASQSPPDGPLRLGACSTSKPQPSTQMEPARPPAPAHTETTWRGCNRHGSGETRETGVWVVGLAARQMGGWDSTATPPWRSQGGRGQWAPLGEAGETGVTERWRGLPTGGLWAPGGPGLRGRLADQRHDTASRWRTASWQTNAETHGERGPSGGQWEKGPRKV